MRHMKSSSLSSELIQVRTEYMLVDLMTMSMYQYCMAHMMIDQSDLELIQVHTMGMSLYHSLK
jgi:hypothetical protein